MADTNTGSTYTSAYRRDSIEIQTAKPTFSRSVNRMAPVPMPPDVTGSKTFKMAAAKPEVYVSWLLGKLGTKFQRQSKWFRGPGIQWYYCEYCLMSLVVGISKRYLEIYTIYCFFRLIGCYLGFWISGYIVQYPQ